ncbi:MAG: hypothetical protein ACK5P6_06600 [Pseudobdellovibrionaceae bacterium]
MKSSIFLFMFVTSTVFAEIKVNLHFTPTANLVYQLDCISNELPHCSRDTYQDLWNKQFLKNNEDQALVKSWGELVNRYRPELEFEESKQRFITGRFEGVKLATKIRIASFQSKSMDDYFNRLDLVVVPKDREKFEKVIRHFYPRFEKWWHAVALPKGKGFAKQTEALLKRPDISKKIKQFAGFYEVSLPDNYIVHVNLFYRPDFEEATSGQQIENYSVAEFLPTEKPVDRIDVIIHELCHFFFENATDEKLASMLRAFEAIGKVEARGAYNLINETLATTLGNGLINKLTMDKKRWEKYSTKPQSFYNNYHIDKASKAILPWMEEWLKENKTLYDSQFVEKYISTLEQNFKDELTTPKLLLNELVLVADNKFNGKFRDTVRKTLRASSMYTSEGDWGDERTLKSYRENANLSALFIVHSSNLNQLKEKNVLAANDFDPLKKYFQEKGRAIYSFKRSQNAPAYVIVASNYDEALKLVEKLGTLKEGFIGVLSL